MITAITNRYLKISDVAACKEIINTNDWIHKFPHKSGLGNHWHRDEAILKWVSILVNFGLFKRGLKVIDMGTGNGCVPYVISSWGNDVTAVDVDRYKPEIIEPAGESNNVNVVVGDFFDYAETVEAGTVDICVDSCAIHCFNPRGDEAVGNYGIKAVSETVYTLLKKGGKFISTTDASTISTIGRFITPEETIKIVQSSGLKLISEFDYDKSENAKNMDYDIVNFVFEKV